MPRKMEGRGYLYIYVFVNKFTSVGLNGSLQLGGEIFCFKTGDCTTKLKILFKQVQTIYRRQDYSYLRQVATRKTFWAINLPDKFFF